MSRKRCGGLLCPILIWFEQFKDMCWQYDMNVEMLGWLHLNLFLICLLWLKTKKLAALRWLAQWIIKYPEVQQETKINRIFYVYGKFCRSNKSVTFEGLIMAIMNFIQWITQIKWFAMFVGLRCLCVILLFSIYVNRDRSHCYSFGKDSFEILYLQKSEDGARDPLHATSATSYIVQRTDSANALRWISFVLMGAVKKNVSKPQKLEPITLRLLYTFRNHAHSLLWI